MKNILLPCVLIATIIATPGSSQSVDEFTQEEIMSIRTRVYAEYYERSCKEQPKQKPSDKKPSKEINSEAYTRIYEMQKTEAEAELKVIGQESFCAMAKGAAEKYVPNKNKPISQDNKGN